MSGSFESALKQFNSSPTVRTLLARVWSEPTSSITGLSGSSLAFLVVALFQARRESICLVAPNPRRAQKLWDDLGVLLPDETVVFFPGREVLPYEFKAPQDEIVAQRLQALSALLASKPAIIITTLRALLEKTITPEALQKAILELKIGRQIMVDELQARLVRIGFSRSHLVEEVGNFAIRGGIVDLFPYTTDDPIRIELFGDEIESIRTFSVLDQRSLAPLQEVLILPRKEFFLPPDELESALADLDRQIEEKIRTTWAYEADQPGIEWLAPLFNLKRATLFDYLPGTTLLLWDDFASLEERVAELYTEADHLFQEAKNIVPTSITSAAIYGSREQFQTSVTQMRTIKNLWAGEKDVETAAFHTREHPAFGGQIELVKRELAELEQNGFLMFITCDNRAQAERLGELLGTMEKSCALLVPALAEGFIYPEARLAIFTDHQIFVRHLRPVRRRRFREGMALASYNSLQPGDYVVHIDFGVGRFLGLERLRLDGRQRDCLELLYQEGDKIFVPIDQFNRVQKFIGKEGEPKLSSLRSEAWDKLKARTKKALLDMAQELIALDAERKARPKEPFAADTHWQRELETSFIYDETVDQLAAIEAIKQDLQKSHPMDRLVCGDVGYGKTEVAIRAAFKVVQDSKQVAVLVPTTILAQQHFVTFTDRLRNYPVSIATLSRFKGRQEQQRIVEQLKTGKLDIVIGTHRLLQSDVEFHDLGLLVIDEEQRFGVVHKEKIKKLKRLVDVLTLTATPIPRTMQLALFGARDLSIINTPPKGRLPVYTEIVEFSDEVIFGAISRELARGGQTYFVHNQVQSIYTIQRYLGQIIPQARTVVVHGQMPEQALEKAMVDFLDGKYDVLLSTSIIENGLDIPSVNTIIINRADKFGLAQLYQLRGRVGRSHHKAYAYLLTPPTRQLTETARKRLKALAQYVELGSGFHLALRDLEIRGAGNLLGPQQHGFIEEVGFELYCQLLEEVVHELKVEKIERPAPVEIDTELDIFLPEEYVKHPAQRIDIYQKLSKVKSQEQLDDLKNEVRDRFGPPAVEVEQLFELYRIKLLAQTCRITKISHQAHRLVVEFARERVFRSQALERLLKGITLPVEFANTDILKMQVQLPPGSAMEQLRQIYSLLQNCQ